MDEDDVVLIVLAKSPRDLEIVRTEHWYRVPTKHAPAHLTQANYIAFYLTKAFGEYKWSIHEYAQVRGHELVQRSDLFPHELDHPRSGEAYFKLQLSPLMQLPQPIVSRRGRRVLFIWTSGRKLSRAVEINDLLGKSEADDALWEGLKEAGIGAERQVVVRDSRRRYRVDYWIPAQCGNLSIIIANGRRGHPRGRLWRHLQFSEQDAIARCGECVNMVKHALRELGGAKYTCTE